MEMRQRRKDEMKTDYAFIQHGLEGEVELTVNGKPVKLDVGARVEVTVKPNFYKSDAKAPVVYVASVLDNERVIYREAQTVSGATGRIDKVARNKPVKPAIEAAPPAEESDA